MKNVNAAIVFVARNMPATVEAFSRNGNPQIRKAAELMQYIGEMPDQDDARQAQSAEDVIFHLPMPEIQQCIALYEAVR